MLKTEFIPISVIDSFFEDPDFIRKKALSYEYGVEGNHPGYRTKCLSIIDSELNKVISHKILSLFIDLNYFIANYDIGIAFQWTPSVWEKGWIHEDGKVYLAGVVYLMPNPPPNSGTLICEDHNNIGIIPQPLKEDAYAGRQDNNNNLELHKSETYKKARKENNSKYKTSITIENVYNRALIYPANYLHAENHFFGTTIEDSRLVLVFFLNTVASNGTFPIDRTNKYKI
jgi:hypothetical protein